MIACVCACARVRVTNMSTTTVTDLYSCVEIWIFILLMEELAKIDAKVVLHVEMLIAYNRLFDCFFASASTYL